MVIDGVDHHQILSESLSQEVLSLADKVYRADGIEGISEQPRVHLTSSGYEHYLVWIDEVLVGYAHITLGESIQSDLVELIIHPDYRGQHLGSILVARVLADKPEARLWAYGNLTAAQRIAEKFELTVQRVLLRMNMHLDTPIDIFTGDGIRAYKPGDEKGILDVNNAAFPQHPEQGGWSIDDIYERMQAPWFDPQGLFIAEYKGKIVGFHWTKIHHNLQAGEIYILAVHPKQARKGVGKTLVLAGLHYFCTQKLCTSILYAEGDNYPALKVYKQLGYQETIRNCVYGRDLDKT